LSKNHSLQKIVSISATGRFSQQAFWVLVFLCAGVLRAQTTIYQGLVIDGVTREPLLGVQVSATPNPIVTGVTDLTGYFLITTNRQSLRFQFSLLGYQSESLQLSPNGFDTIALFPNPVTLPEAEVIIAPSGYQGLKSLSVQTLEAASLRRQVGSGLGEVLAQFDGVSFISTGTNIQLPVIHGLYGNRILILQNGFRHGFQNWGTDHAPEMDIHGADRIEVVKGAAGVKFGPDALGGAVVITQDGLSLNKPFYATSASSFQSNGLGYGTRLHVGRGYQRFSYYFSGHFQRVGDRRAPDYLLTNSGARTQGFQAGARYASGSWDLQMRYSDLRQNLGILRAAIGNSGPALIRNMESPIPTYIKPFSYDINEPNQLVGHQLATVSVTHFFANSHLTLRYGRQWNARREFDVRRNADLPILDLQLNTHDVQLEWEHHRKLRRSGTWGIQYFSQQNQNNPGTSITPFIPNYATSRWSAFLLESLKSNDRISWELGVRYDLEQNAVGGRDSRQQVFQDQFQFSSFTLAFGQIYQINPRLTFRNHVGTGWRPPNMAELYSFGQHESQTTFGLLRYEPDSTGRIMASRVLSLNERAIRPEQSYKYNATLDWSKDHNRLEATGYVNYIENFIFSRPIGVLGTARGPMPTFIMDQSDALFLGTDITYHRSYHLNGQATAGISYIWSHNVQRNETLINQPPIHIHLRLRHAFPKVFGFDLISCGLQPSYTFRQFQAPRYIPIRDLVEGTSTIAIEDPIFDFQMAPAGYFLLHAQLRLEKGRFALNLEARNLLNTRYRDYLNNMRYFADEVGFNFICTLTLNL
jgi:iron complex outermembrane receptor protein